MFTATSIENHIARIVDRNLLCTDADGIERFLEMFAAKWTATSDAKGPKWVSEKGAVRRTAPPANEIKQPAQRRRAAPKPAAAPQPRAVEQQLHTPALAPKQSKADNKPAIDLADKIADKLKTGPISAADVKQLAADAYGGTMAQGKYGYSEATDALEAGFNKSLIGETDPSVGLDKATKEAEKLAAQVNQLPTQTNRSGEKDTHQQFSTPPHYAYAVAWAANLNPGEVVLEPSAGTGCLAVQAMNAGADVYANELSKRRADFLEDILGPQKVSLENAEQIAGILPNKGVPQPTAILMNPPFSQTAGRAGKDLLAGANHISEALRLLAPGGRLVAIVGKGMDPARSTYRGWFDKLRKEYGADALRANVEVPGDEYKKFGTSFGTRVLVIDKPLGKSAAPTDTAASRANVAREKALQRELKLLNRPVAEDVAINDKGRSLAILEGKIRNTEKSLADLRKPPETEKRPTVTGTAANIPDLMKMLEGVRNDRPKTAGQPPSQPSGRGVPATAQAGAGRTNPAAAAARSGMARPAGTAQPVGTQGHGLPAQPGRAGLGGEPVRGGPGVPAKQPQRDAGRGGVAGVQGGARQSLPGDEAQKRGRRGAPARGEPERQPASGVPRLRPAEPIKLDTSTPRPPDPHFTGTDRLGRKWVDGKLVSKVEAEEHAPPGSLTDEGTPAKGPPEAKTQADLGASLYEAYRPAKARVVGAHLHPAPLVESAAMSAVEPPDVHYTPHLSPDIIEKGMLSEAALETVIYAGQAHSAFLPAAEEEDKRRRGYFIGDGTGSGKGRQIAGVMVDNWNQGRKKHVWVSQKQTLFEDALRDWKDLGQDPQQMVHFDKLREKPGAKTPKPPEPGFTGFDKLGRKWVNGELVARDEGVAFITYDTLKTTPKDPNKPSNLDQLVNWLGKDFDGVIAFDEAHGMANALDTEGGRGLKKASAKALAGIKLQQLLPKARILYVSATGATEVSNLAYAERLGIWGRGTPFATKQDFIARMQEGGVAAMEAVAQSLKATGSYNARSLSFNDGTPEGRVEYGRLTHRLSEDQLAQYNACADAWQVVLQNIDKALESAGATEAKNAKSAALSQFWGAQQRFFNQVMTSMQTPSVINDMEKDIAEGRAPVVQLVNTMEASTKRALLKAKGKKEDDEEEDLEDLDLSPKQTLMQYLDKSFPVHRYEEYQDQDGNTQYRVVQDSRGVAVEDPAAVAMRDEMLTMVGSLRIPESPIDMIINHFGPDNVAEVTGRTVRLVNREQDDGSIKKVEERRVATAANSAETQAFQSGKKKILVFSDAGGTGRSYHADRNAQNQDQRIHYMLQPGWRADNAIQGLGRTHRTNQKQAPVYKLVEIDQLKAQKRFISTIARRLDQLGALTKGQRQTGSGGLFSAADNLESKEAKVGLEQFFADLQSGSIEDLDPKDILKQLGYVKSEEEEKRRKRGPGFIEAPPMTQFLNRLLSLRVDTQGRVFEEFERRMTEAVRDAVKHGKLDTGVENFPALKMIRKGEQVVWSDKDTGAKVRHFVVNAHRKATKTAWDALSQGELPLGFVKNKQSGRVYAYYKTSDYTDPKTGHVQTRFDLRSPVGEGDTRPTHEVEPGYYSRYHHIERDVAESLWKKEYGEAPDITEHEEHFVTGAILPVWDRIPGDKPKIFRVRTDDGETVVGRYVPRRHVDTLLKNMGVASESTSAHAPAHVHANLSTGKAARATMANGWKLKPVRVQGERRIELTGPSVQNIRELEQDGVIRERIGFDTRFFVPTGERGAKILERITQNRPITDVEDAAKPFREVWPETVAFIRFGDEEIPIDFDCVTDATPVLVVA